MERQELLDALKEVVKGRYYIIEKVKDLGEGITKVSVMKIRLGINYSHMSINADRQTGELPWGQWEQGYENLVIKHKPKGCDITKYYLRITSCDPAHPGCGVDVISTRYYKDGVEITYDEVVSIIGEKKVADKPSTVYNINFDNITKIGK